MKKLSLFTIFLIFILLIAGCQKSQKAPVKKGDSKKLEGQAVYKDLELTAKVDKTPFKPREDIKVNVSLTNTGQKDIKFTFSSGQKFDLVAKDKGGEEVFRWSKGKFFTEALIPETLKPGEKIDKQFSLNLNNKSDYKITAETVKLYFDGQEKSTTLVTSPVEITVE